MCGGVRVLPSVVRSVAAVADLPRWFVLLHRDRGMAQLRLCFKTQSIRSPLSGVILLAMHVILPSFFATDMTEHLPEATAIMDKCLEMYPDGAIFLGLQGRLARMKGDIPGAIKVRVAPLDKWRGKPGVTRFPGGCGGTWQHGRRLRSASRHRTSGCS